MNLLTLWMLGLFFLSGAAGLVYEVLWTRQLALIFGVTTYAVSAVLATYMGGLALGSWAVGRRVDRVRSPLMLYAILEAIIGIYALLVPFLLDALRPLYIEIARLGLSYPVFSAIRAALAAGVLLVPTILMGGTFPVLVQHWARMGLGVNRGTGILYFVNTGGAIVGCSLAGFVLLERFGLAGTNYLAATTNLVLAAAAVVVARRSTAAREARDEPDGRVTGEPLSPAVARLVLACAALSGFVSLVAQVLWSRALLRYLYNSTYAFTGMLATFLLGITIGSVLFTLFLAHRRRPLWTLAALQAGVAAGFVVTIWLFPQMPQLTAWLLGGEVVDSFEAALLTMLLRAMFVLLPPVVFLGAIFPLAAVLYSSGRRDLGASIGRVYASNTFGAIAGSLACAFVLIPSIGMWETQRLLLVLSLVGAGATAMAAARTAGTRVAAVLASVAAGGVLLAATPDDVFRSTFLQAPNMTMDFYEEGATDTVAVQSAYGQRTIVYEDQRGTASTATYGINFFLGHLPMLLHPDGAKKVLHICFGVGNSLSAVAAHEELERVDNVELSPHALSAGPLFWSNDNVLDHPKVRTIIDDGRNYLMTTPEKYDVIQLEPPETFTAGVINLYTVEFYRDALEHLAPGGLMMQWIPTANGPIESEKELFRAFSDVFPHVTMWWLLDSGCALLIGSREPLRLDYQRLRRHMQEGRVKQDMALSRVRGADHLLSFFVFDEAAFAEFVEGARPTRDDYTVLDFTMPRYAGSGFGLGQFNMKVRGDGGLNPIGFALQRRNFYLDQRRSVVPLLTNLGGETPAEIERRILASRDLPMRTESYTEGKWRRMREEGTIPPP